MRMYSPYEMIKNFELSLRSLVRNQIELIQISPLNSPTNAMKNAQLESPPFLVQRRIHSVL